MGDLNPGQGAVKVSRQRLLWVLPCWGPGSRAWLPPPIPQQDTAMDLPLTLLSRSELLWLWSFHVPRVTTRMPPPHPRPSLGGVPQGRKLVCSALIHRVPGPLNRRADPRWFWTHSQLEEKAWGVSVKSLDLHPHSSPQSSLEACREGVGRTAGSCRLRPPETAMLLQRNDTAPGRDPRRRPPAAGLPARGGPECRASTSSPGRNPCEVMFPSRWQRSSLSTLAPAPPRAHSSLPTSPGPLGCLCRGPPGIPGPTRGASRRGPHSRWESPAHGRRRLRPDSRPRSSALPVPEDAPSRGPPGPPPGEESSAGKGPVCVLGAGGGRAEQRRPGRREGGSGRGGAGRTRAERERKGGAGETRERRVTHPRSPPGARRSG